MNPTPASVPTVAFNAHRILLGLWLTVTGLLLIHVTLTVVHYEVTDLPWLLRQIFDVDEEDSIPTWYSAMALLLTAGVLGWWSARVRIEQGTNLYHWLGLAIGFTGLSLDEIAGVHETLNSITDVSWTIPGMVVVALIAGAYLPFLASLPRPLAIRFVVSGAIYLGGAIGVEWATEPYLADDELNTLAYNLWTAVEEGMEMIGVLLFLGALIGHIETAGGLKGEMVVSRPEVSPPPPVD